MPPRRFARRIAPRKFNQDHRRAIRKLSDNANVAAHRLDRFAQRRKEKIASFFKPGNAILRDSQNPRHASLRKFAGLAEIAQTHFLGNELGRAILDLFSLGGIQFFDPVAHVYRHDSFLSSRQQGNMRVEPVIRFSDQFAVESLFTAA